MDIESLEKEIQSIYDADQAERLVGWDNIDFDVMRENDKPRLKRAREIYALVTAGKVTLSGECLYQLGMLFQHSPDVEDYLIAAEVAELSCRAECSTGCWLSAAAEDRYLFTTIGKQKWGTQFQKNNEGEWGVVPMMDDAQSGVTDEMRAKKNIPPRAEQLRVYLARDDI